MQPRHRKPRYPTLVSARLAAWLLFLAIAPGWFASFNTITIILSGSMRYCPGPEQNKNPRVRNLTVGTTVGNFTLMGRIGKIGYIAMIFDVVGLALEDDILSTRTRKKKVSAFCLPPFPVQSVEGTTK